MTTLLSKNEKESLNLSATGFKLAGGDMLLIGTESEMGAAEEWLRENGVSGVYFDPMDDVENYNSFLFVTIEGGSVAIRLYS